MSDHKWELTLRVPGGHRFFRSEIEHGVAVADDSGDTPERADDGIYWLDRARTIVIVKRWNAEHAYLPLRNEQGHERDAPTSFAGALMVAHAFGMAIVTRSDNRVYRVKWMEGA